MDSSVLLAGTYGPLLMLLPPNKLAVMVMHETVNSCIKASNDGVPLTRLMVQIGELVELEVSSILKTY